jgi:uncharacterized protein (TIGR02246 family)
VDNDKKLPRHPGFAEESQPARGLERSAEMREIYRKLEPELRRSRPNPEAIAAALEAVQRLATENDAEQASVDVAPALTTDRFPANGLSAGVCGVCGHNNGAVSKFCGMCGTPMGAADRIDTGYPPEEHQPGHGLALPPNPFPNDALTSASGNREVIRETHHYHHHYHHHYFPGGYEGGVPPRGAEPMGADAVREDKMRPNAAQRGDMSRAEAAVRRVTQEWVLACNTKHLDDLLELYAADALVLRSNYPPVRGAAAIREFFFGALEAGLGEVEVEPLRAEIMGDLAYEAGRCKALIPGATGKRREERGKYLWVCARQSGGEWKLTADCWSSDLSLTMLESDIPPGAVIKVRDARKTP